MTLTIDETGSENGFHQSWPLTQRHGSSHDANAVDSALSPFLRIASSEPALP
jgi:hypothetical protein